MCQNWLLMDENEIELSFYFKDERCGLCPKLGGTADKHIRPCHVDGRGIFLWKAREKDDKSSITRTNRD